MITSITVPKSSSGNFTIGDAYCRLHRADGFGVPKTRLVSDDYPTDQGSRLISQYYDRRRVVLGGTIVKSTVSDFMSYKREMVDAFSFLNAVKTLLMTLDDTTALQFYAVAASELRLSQEPGMLTMARWEIELDLLDPFLYSQTLHSETGYVTTIEGGAIVPATIPMELSGGISNELSISNAGNARVWPSTFQIHGPGTNFVIKNRTRDLTLNFNTTIADGSYVDIDFKNKTALLNGLTNVYGYISGDFWDLALGTNVITLTVGSGDDSGTRIEISWRDAYWGV